MMYFDTSNGQVQLQRPNHRAFLKKAIILFICLL